MHVGQRQATEIDIRRVTCAARSADCHSRGGCRSGRRQRAALGAVVLQCPVYDWAAIGHPVWALLVLNR